MKIKIFNVERRDIYPIVFAKFIYQSNLFI
jgi:hypothetical protein